MGCQSPTKLRDNTEIFRHLGQMLASRTARAQGFQIEDKIMAQTQLANISFISEPLTWKQIHPAV